LKEKYFPQESFYGIFYAIFEKITIMKKLLSYLFLILILTSCYPEIELKNFDSKSWKNDITPCRLLRNEMLDNLLAQKSTLIGKQETLVRQTLGMPEMYELDQKMQKILYYDLGKDTVCHSKFPSLRLEFTGLGQLKFIELSSIKTIK